ncbi:MAG TPA: hypothetical protein PL033_01040 [Candidatus Brocadiia bacterium]|nr:hypothetical protein [Candidatus Brocadiia bacterium]
MKPSETSELARVTEPKPVVSRDYLWLVLTVLLGGLTLLPSFAYIDYPTNDRGRDLYTAMLAMDAKLPYKDFDWPYGPAMPFYYAAWYRILGVNMLAYETGETVLVMLCCAGMFMLGRELLGGAGGFALSMLWLCTAPIHHMSHTGNHIGGILLIILALISFVRLLRFDASILRTKGESSDSPEMGRELVKMSVFLGLLCLVKLNIGVALAAGMFGSLFIQDALVLKSAGNLDMERILCGMKSSVLSMALFIGIICIVYIPLVASMPRAAIGRCFPWMGGYHNLYSGFDESLVREISEFANDAAMVPVTQLAAKSFKFFRAMEWFAALAALLAWLLVASLKPARGAKSGASTRLPASLILLMFVVAHEYLTAGSWYSLGFFAGPIMTAGFAAGVAYFAGRVIPRELLDQRQRSRIGAVAMSSAGLVLCWVAREQSELYVGEISKTNAGWEYLSHPRGGVWHMRMPSDPTSWANTVLYTARRIEAETMPGEAIFVGPMDSIYLFLADRPSVCRLVDFSGYQNVSEAEENAIIEAMEAQNVRCAVWTNTSVWIKGASERFGDSHCRKLGEYIRNYFPITASYGFTQGYGLSYMMHGTTVRMRGGEGPKAEPWRGDDGTALRMLVQARRAGAGLKK